MPLDIKIIQEENKDIDFNLILGDELNYGTFDGLSLEVEEMKEGELVLFNPNHIARGISIYDAENVLEMVTFLPTNPLEIEDVFKIVQRITDTIECTIEINEMLYTKETFMNALHFVYKQNINEGNMMFDKVINENLDHLTIYATLWPLQFNKEEAFKFKEDFNVYYEWLHNKQSVEAVYAKPQYFERDNKIEGAYFLTEATNSIFPKVPEVPMGVMNPKTNQPLECETYNVLLYSLKFDGIIGAVPYEVFIHYMKDKSIEYDYNHIYFDGLTLEEMDALLEVNK